MTALHRRLQTLRALAWSCAALVIAITTLSAYIRLSRTGLGCQPWPACYVSEALRTASLDSVAIGFARIAHRISASAVLVAIIAALMISLARNPALWRPGRLVLGLLGLAAFLAAFGRATADSLLPAVTLGNLLAGMALFAVACAFVRATRDDGPPAASRRLRLWAWAAAVLLLVQMALGGLVSSAHAGLSCPALAACSLDAGSWALFNPFHAAGDPAQPLNPAGALVHMAHRLGGLVVSLVLVALGLAAWRGRRRWAGALLVVLPPAQIAAGVLLVSAGLPLAVALVHNVIAAVLLTTTAALLDG
ncbi:COX15/CtaA family protein [Ramlibacter tataouinensis]|uniref:COX15/CtaA family protein n=1 Tax=Ramlibacter tataouinensis TaxID=94132 RepID=UPI0022F3F517|nr:COX15/CtaA family protein [Ramlibacter tataouinensis]WBY03190.1 COX15/CtaA family protein [Ramlibacter tataouinensis]